MAPLSCHSARTVSGSSSTSRTPITRRVPISASTSSVGTSSPRKPVGSLSEMKMSGRNDSAAWRISASRILVTSDSSMRRLAPL